MDSRENLIGGARRPAATGLRFVARPGDTVRWPRSAAPDVDAAFDALERAAGAWAERPRGERLRIVAAASRALVDDPDPGGDLAAAVGLEADEAFPRPDPERLDPRGLDGAAGLRAGGEIAVVGAHAAELLEGPARATFAELARGRAVLLLSSGALPEAAERIARALFEAGLPRAVLALVHEDGDTCIAAAIEHGRAASLRVCAAREWVDALRRRIERVPLRASFGAGVSAGTEFATPLLDVPRSVRLDADPAADPAEVARRVARGAFDRRETLGGQRAGRIGWVRIAPRAFSRVTAALLDELEGSGDRYRPASWLDPGTPKRLETLRVQGVDEGATLIHEHRGAASRSRSGRATLLRLVFTNVEPGMRLAQDLDAAPVLLLARAGVGADRRARP